MSKEKNSGSYLHNPEVTRELRTFIDENKKGSEELGMTKAVLLKWLADYIMAIEKADADCEQKLILPELKGVKNLLDTYVGKTHIPEIPGDLQLSDFVPEFIEKLIDQLKLDYVFENAGTPVPWMKIVGRALICWIRDNHPELYIDVIRAQEDIVDLTSPDGKAETEFGEGLRETTDKVIVEAIVDGVKEPEEAIADEPKKVAELPNSMRCCNCKLSKLANVLICKCCGGTTFEGYYDKSRQESKSDEVIAVKVSPNGVEDIITQELVESGPDVIGTQEELKKVLKEMSKEIEEMNGFSRSTLKKFNDKVEQHLGSSIRELSTRKPDWEAKRL